MVNSVREVCNSKILGEVHCSLYLSTSTIVLDSIPDLQYFSASEMCVFLMNTGTLA